MLSSRIAGNKVRGLAGARDIANVIECRWLVIQFVRSWRCEIDVIPVISAAAYACSRGQRPQRPILRAAAGGKPETSSFPGFPRYRVKHNRHYRTLRIGEFWDAG